VEEEKPQTEPVRQINGVRCQNSFSTETFLRAFGILAMRDESVLGKELVSHAAELFLKV
jgi:hypothetical protein